MDAKRTSLNSPSLFSNSESMLTTAGLHALASSASANSSVSGCLTACTYLNKNIYPSLESFFQKRAQHCACTYVCTLYIFLNTCVCVCMCVCICVCTFMRVHLCFVRVCV